jgi:putative flippase GtrA
MICLTFGCSVFLNFVTSRQFVYEKLEKQSLWSFVGRPRKLLIRHSSSSSELLGLLCHVIVVNVEHQLLPQLSLSRNLWSCEPMQP